MRFGRLAGIGARLAVISALLAAAWIYRGGFGDVSGALGVGGWRALAAVCVWHLLPVALCAWSENVLAPERPFATFMLARWIHESAGELTGFLPLSSELAGARTLIRRLVPVAEAAALTAVNLTAEAISLFLYVAVGIALWLMRHPMDAVARWALIGLALGVPLIAGLFLVQRPGLLRVAETLPAKLLPRLFSTPDEPGRMREAVAALYREKSRVVVSVALHLAGWMVAAGEAYIALILLGHRLALPDLISLEAFIMALRSAAIFVPAGLGVQEGAYVVIGAALGLGPETALAVSLLKRGRELLFGVPGLIVWQTLEGRFGRRATG